MKTRLGVALLSAFLGGCFDGAGATDVAMVKLKLGAHVFHIPEENYMEKKRPFWIDWIPGLDDGSREVAIVIANEEIQRSIPAYQSDVDIFGTLAVLTTEEIKRYSDSKRFRDEWQGIGSYEGRRIEPWGNTGWVKVFHRAEQQSWTVMRRSPDPAKPLPDDPLDFYVARCTVTGPPGQGSTDCLTYAFFDDIVVDFHLSAANLVHIDQVRTFVKAKVQTWRASETPSAH